MNYFFYALMFILLMAILGMGLALLATPRGLRKYALLLAPIIGYCYLTLAGWYFYIADFQGTDKTAIYVFILPILFLLLAYRRRQSDSGFQTTNPEKAKGLFLAIAIGLSGFVLSSLPFVISPDVVKMDNLTSISMGSHDIADTATLATYLKEFARSDTVGFLGQTPKLRWLVEKSIFGGSYSTAFAGTVLSLETYQLQSMSLHLFFFLAICLLFVLAREGFGYNQTMALIVTAIFAVNSVIYYGIYQGFQAQIYALPLSLFLYLLLISALQSAITFKDYLKYTPLTILGLWGVSITYPHVLPIILAPIIIYAVLLAIVKRQYQKIGLFFVNLAIAGAISALLAPDRAYSIVTYTLFMGKVKAGWFIPLLSLGKWFGVNFYDLEFTHRPGLFNLIISLVLLSLSGNGIWKAGKRKMSSALLAATFLTTIICGYLVIGYLNQESGQFGGYKSFKFMSYLLPMLLLSSFFWIRKFSFKGLTFGCRTIALVLLIAGLGGLATFTAGKLIFKMVGSHLVVDQGLAGLSDINRHERIRSVNVLSKNWWDNLWIVNFLLEKKLYFEISTYTGRNASKLRGQWDIFRCSTPDRDAMSLPDGTVYSGEGIVLKEIGTGGLAVDAFDARLSPVANHIQLQVNEQITVTVRIRNDSRISWVNDCNYEGRYALNLSYHVRALDGKIILFDGARTPMPKTIEPEEEIIVEALIRAPDMTGQFVIELDLVLENITWFADKGSKTASFGLTVK